MSRAGYFTGWGSITPIIGADGRPKFRRFGPWRVPLFDFRNSTTDPLTFHWLGVAYQPDRHFRTDGGSIPPPLWSMRLGPWDRPRAYPIHDSGFTLGGLYVSRQSQPFAFERMTRQQLNALLAEAIPADGGSWWDRARVSAGLAIGSRFCWDERAQARARRAAGL